MIYLSDLQALIDSWQKRMHNPSYSLEYRDGMLDCAFELTQLLSKELFNGIENHAQSVS